MSIRALIYFPTFDCAMHKKACWAGLVSAIIAPDLVGGDKAMSDIVVVPLRYDGLDAEQHELDLDALGESLRGAARILGVVGHFATSGQYVMQARSMGVRVIAREPKANCYTLETVLQFAQQQGLLQGAVAPIVGAVVGLVIAKASNNRAEMKHLAASLNKALEMLAQNNADQREQLVAVVEKMTSALRPAARMLVAPVGRSCREMRVGPDVVIDQPTAAAIRGEPSDEVDQERSYALLLTELDLESRTAKIRLENDPDRRIKAHITDPVITPYAQAFADQVQIEVRAKAVMREGEIRAIYISNAP